MPDYVFQWNYRSSLAAGEKGDKISASEALAEAINRDSPGVLVLLEEEPVVVEDEQETEVETRAPDAPKNNRQVTGSKKRTTRSRKKTGE